MQFSFSLPLISLFFQLLLLSPSPLTIVSPLSEIYSSVVLYKKKSPDNVIKSECHFLHDFLSLLPPCTLFPLPLHSLVYLSILPEFLSSQQSFIEDSVGGTVLLGCFC